MCKTLRISQICSQNSATGFDHRVQNALRVQNAVSWVSKFAVGAHFRGCVWLENFASVSEYAGVVWTGARFRGCTFSRVHIFAGTPASSTVDVNSRFSGFQFSAFWSNGLASSVFIFAPILLRFFLLSSSMQGLK